MTRCHSKKYANKLFTKLAKSSHVSFYYEIDLFPNSPKSLNIWTAFVRKIVTKNYENSLNLVTLAPGAQMFIFNDYFVGILDEKNRK